MITRHHCAALLACAAFFTLSPVAATFAQTPEELAAQKKKAEAAAAVTDNSTYLSTIVAPGSKKLDPYTTPGPVSNITADEVDLFGNKNIDDALRASPGTFTRDNPQNPGLAINIRGLEGSGRVNMMIDGVRQNFRFTGHEAQGFAYVDSNFLSGVDITRGAVAGVGGAGALVGAANLRTYSIDELLQDGKNYGGFATSSFGDNGSGWSNAVLGAYRVNDTLGFLGGISKRDPKVYQNGNGEDVPFTDSDLISGIFKTEITPNDEHSLKLNGILYNNDFVANSYGQTLDSQTFSANYAYTPGNDLVDLRANIAYNKVTMEYNEFFCTAGPFCPPSAVGRKIEDKGFSFDVSNTSHFDLGEVAAVSNYGVEYFSDDYDVTKGGVNGSGKTDTSSVFNSTKLSYGITDVTLGLRYDRIQTDGNGEVRAGGPLGMPAGPYSVDKSDGRLNPSVTVALNPTDWFQPYVTYAETMRAPTVNEMLLGGNTHGGSSSFANPFLEPEVSKGWEIGGNFVFDDVLASGDSLRFKANYFINDIENYITGARTASFQSYFINNPGTSRVQGVELQGAYDAGFAFASLAYTYTDSDLPTQVNGIGAQSYVPQNVAALTAGARFLEQHLTVGARLALADKSYIGAINAGGGADTMPGYGLVDIFTNYKFDNGLELSASVSNLFDKVYTPALSTAASLTVDSGRGRTFLVTAKANF